VAEHFNRITVLTGQVRQYSDDRAFGVVVERLIDLITIANFEAITNPPAQSLRPQ
jgi:hypothetical protein